MKPTRTGKPMRKWVRVGVRAIRQESKSGKAFQLIYENGRIGWIPKSVVADAADYERGGRDLTLSIQGWFAAKERIEEDGPRDREPGEEG